MSGTARDVRVLVVCTGNVCRSPAAQLLLADRLGTAAVRVTSAGLRALVGHPIDPRVAALLAEVGVREGVAARQLMPADVQAADLVLTMTQEQRAAVVRSVPSAVRRTLLLLEGADAAAATAAEGWPAHVGDDPAARLAALPRLAARHRRPVAAGTAREVPDPFGQSPEVHRTVFTALAAGVDRLASSLG